MLGGARLTLGVARTWGWWWLCCQGWLTSSAASESDSGHAECRCEDHRSSASLRLGAVAPWGRLVGVGARHDGSAARSSSCVKGRRCHRRYTDRRREW